MIDDGYEVRVQWNVERGIREVDISHYEPKAFVSLSLLRY